MADSCLSPPQSAVMALSTSFQDTPLSVRSDDGLDGSSARPARRSAQEEQEDEMVAMFNNLVLHGVIGRKDLVTGGFTEVTSRWAKEDPYLAGKASLSGVRARSQREKKSRSDE
jgi:hypothetical protein